MKKMHDLVTKKQWFLVFNFGALLFLALAGRLTSSLESAIIHLLVLGVLNLMALISTRSFPNWK